MNKRGVALIAACMVIVGLVILGGGVMTRAFSERRLTQRYVDSVKAFWLSEAGVSRALNELRADFSVPATPWSGTLTQGQYSVEVEAVGQMRKVTAYGYVPNTAAARVERIVEAMISGGTPSNFYDNAIYSAGDVDINGNRYSVTGDVLYADVLDVNHPGNITGAMTHDPDISPLARFDFEELHTISAAQGNVYDEARLDDVKKGDDSFPGSFWYIEPTDPADPTTGTPNIVYVETDLQLNGNIGTVGGFFVVVGDVITDPEDTEDLTINGIGQIEGVVYTRGTFRINGGAGILDVDGGVWAGEEARLNGNAHIAYNQDFMAAIEGLDIEVEVQIVSWRDTQNPYMVSP